MPGDGRFIRVREEREVLTLTIDRPEVLNALHPPAHAELAALLDHFAATDALRVAIITGGGARAFCVGNDLKAVAAEGEAAFPATGFAGLTHRHGLWKPVIAAVNGLCLGGGLEIAAAADIAIAAEHAEFGLPEPRVGAAASGGGGLQRLARQIPAKPLMALALRGTRIGAAEALRIGLVSEVVPAAGLAARAAAIAAEIVAGAPLAIAATKQVILESLAEPDLDAALARTYPAVERMRASEDAREGPRAFAEKRPPRWRGR